MDTFINGEDLKRGDVIQIHIPEDRKLLPVVVEAVAIADEHGTRRCKLRHLESNREHVRTFMRYQRIHRLDTGASVPSRSPTPESRKRKTKV